MLYFYFILFYVEGHIHIGRGETKNNNNKTTLENPLCLDGVPEVIFISLRMGGD